MKSLITNVIVNKGKAKIFGKAISISILNQIISSGTNLVLGIYLARVLTHSEFGLYGIGFAIVLLYSSIGNALFLTQMVIHVPDKAPEDRMPYAARMFILLVFFSLLTIFVVVLILFLDSIWSQLLNKYTNFCIAATALSIPYLIKDFLVRHSYTLHKEVWALVINIFIAVTLFALLFLQQQLPEKIDSVSVQWIYAVSNMTGVVIGLTLSRLPIFSLRLREITYDAREAWVGGGWALGGSLVFWLQSQAYVYITAYFLGSAGVGHANAARLLITPVLFVITAITQMAMPRLAELRTTNPRKILKMSSMVTLALVVFSIVYSIFLLAFLDKITPILLASHQYDQIAPLAAAWCLVLILQTSRNGTIIVLQVIKNFRDLTLVNTFSAIISIVATIILIQQVGAEGAILGIALAELVFCICIFFVVRKYKLNGVF